MLLWLIVVLSPASRVLRGVSTPYVEKKSFHYFSAAAFKCVMLKLSSRPDSWSLHSIQLHFHRGSSGSREQHNLLSFCNPMHQSPEPAHFTAQPNTRSETNTTEKRTRSRVASGQNYRCLCGWRISSLWTWNLTCFIWLTSLQTEHTLKGNGALSNLTLRASTPTAGAKTLSKGCDNHRAKRRPCPTSRAGSAHFHISHTHSQGKWPACWGKMWLAFISKKPLQQICWTYTVYIGMLPQKIFLKGHNRYLFLPNL